MNERIKELAEQVGLEMCSCGCEMPTRQSVKFAELIVRECMNVLHDNELWNRHISHALKEHFGIE